VRPLKRTGVLSEPLFRAKNPELKAQCLALLSLLLLSGQSVSAAVSDQALIRYLEQSPPGFAQFLQQVQQHAGFAESHLELAIEMTEPLNAWVQTLQTHFDAASEHVHPALKVHVFPSPVFNAYCVAGPAEYPAYIAISTGMILGLMAQAWAYSNIQPGFKGAVLPADVFRQTAAVAQRIANQDLPAISTYNNWTENPQARQLFDNMLLFILAHETAHYYAGHLETVDHDAEAVLRKEAEADQLAFGHLKTLAHQNMFWPGSLLPVFYLFEAIDQSTKTEQVSKRQHPPATQRLNAAHQVMGPLLYQPLVRGKSGLNS